MTKERLCQDHESTVSAGCPCPRPHIRPWDHLLLPQWGHSRGGVLLPTALPRPLGLPEGHRPCGNKLTSITLFLCPLSPKWCTVQLKQASTSLCSSLAGQMSPHAAPTSLGMVWPCQIVGAVSYTLVTGEITPSSSGQHTMSSSLGRTAFPPGLLVRY